MGDQSRELPDQYAEWRSRAGSEHIDCTLALVLYWVLHMRLKNPSSACRPNGRSRSRNYSISSDHLSPAARHPTDHTLHGAARPVRRHPPWRPRRQQAIMSLLKARFTHVQTFAEKTPNSSAADDFSVGYPAFTASIRPACQTAGMDKSATMASTTSPIMIECVPTSCVIFVRQKMLLSAPSRNMVP